MNNIVFNLVKQNVKQTINLPDSEFEKLTMKDAISIACLCYNGLLEFQLENHHYL